MNQTTNTPTPAEESPAVDVLLELETTIKTHISGIDKRKSELKKKREMVESALLNDETYRLHNDQAKEAAKIKSKTKKQILDQQENKQLVADTLELASEVKEMDGALSDYLREYQRMSGSTEIETDDGDVREIVYVAKLVKKSSKAK